MPSLHKRFRSPYWVASYQDAYGRWLKTSTKTTNKAEAWKMAMAWEELESAGRAGRLIESQCRKVVADIHEKVTGTPIVFYTSRNWLEEWMAGKQGTTAPRTMQKYRQVIADFIKYLKTRADQPLNAITGKDIRAYRDFLAKSGVSASTVNSSVRKVLAVPFLAAVRGGLLQINPVAGIEALLDEEGGEKDVFTADQIRSLMAHADGDWVGMILIGYYTGLRMTDIATLTWENVDLETGCIRGVKPTKTKRTGKVLVIPIESELKDWLGAQRQGTGKTPVLPSLVGKSGGGKSGLSKHFKTIMTRAGIVGRTLRTADGKGRHLSSLSFNSLRHTCNSAMKNAGVSQEDRMRITGHSSARINDIYTHAEETTLRAAVSKIPTLKT
jgi:integrase